MNYRATIAFELANGNTVITSYGVQDQPEDITAAHHIVLDWITDMMRDPQGFFAVLDPSSRTIGVRKDAVQAWHIAVAESPTRDAPPAP